MEAYFAARLGLSVLLGFLIGAERQITGHPAGIRTNILVCLGASMFSLFPVLIGAGDMTRTAAQVVTGVGFLCSAIIFKDGSNVRGLNTAATIWCTAAIGVLASSENWKYALIAAGILLGSNILFRPLAKRLHSLAFFDDGEHFCSVSVTCLEEKEFLVRSIMMKEARSVKRLTLVHLESGDIVGGRVKVEALFSCGDNRRDDVMEELVGKMGILEGVFSVGWELVEE